MEYWERLNEVVDMYAQFITGKNIHQIFSGTLNCILLWLKEDNVSLIRKLGINMRIIYM